LWVTIGSDASWLAMRATERAASLAWVVALGAAAYFAALWLLGFRVGDFSRRGVD
jgi:putative peptidoglycan lipid II flippase